MSQCILCETHEDVEKRFIIPRHRDDGERLTAKPICERCHDQYHWRPSNVARRKSRKMGGSRKPLGYGYRKVYGRIIPIPEQIATIEQIIELRHVGYSWDDIVDVLEREDRPTARGGRWHAGTVISIYERECPNAKANPMIYQHPGQAACRYGYRLDECGQLAEDTHEQNVIRWMRQRREAGETLECIAERLNESKVPTKQGKRWYGSSVGNLLRREGVR